MRRVMLYSAWILMMWISGMRVLRLGSLQGSALGAGCWFTTELRGDVQEGIREVIGAEVGDVPSVIVSVGVCLEMI